MNDIVLDQDLTMRIVDERDAAELYDCYDNNREWLSRWMKVPKSLEEVAEQVAWGLQGFDDRRVVSCLLWHGDTVVGACSAFDIAEDHGIAEFGYWLGEDATGSGYATASLKTIVGYVFTNFDVQRAEIYTAVDNAGGRAVAERAGFKLEGVRRQCERMDDRVLDHAMYGLLRSEWRAQSVSVN